MTPETPSLYDAPPAMEPLFPESRRAELSELSCEILRKAGQLSGQMPTTVVRKRVAKLVREMNSYYSNLIEGHKTLPRDIERALREDYDNNPAKRANQHLSRAHIEVEELMTNRIAGTRQRLSDSNEIQTKPLSLLAWE